jgi:hypothetical protein
MSSLLKSGLKRVVQASLLLATLSSTVAFAQGGHPARCSGAIDEACATKNPIKQSIRMDKVRELYNGLIFPANVGVLADPTSVEHIFQQGVVKGRISPAGTFGDFEGVLEYFYGLVSSPLSRSDGIKIRSIVASGDKVAIEVDIHFCNAPLDNPALVAMCDPDVPTNDGLGVNSTFRETGFFTFNADDRIISFDLALLNLGLVADSLTPEQRTQRIINACTALTTAHYDLINQQPVFQGTCTSNFDEVSDFPVGLPVTDGQAMTNCITYMSSLPFGSYNHAETNSFTCRELHTLITGLRPDVHCPHTSVSGGGVCVDTPLSSYFAEEF